MSHKFLIYKVSGGLNHMLVQINNAIELSKMTERILIIDCKNGAFSNKFDDYFEIPDIKYLTGYEKIEDIDNQLIESSVKCKNTEYFLLNKRVNLCKNEIIKSSEKFLFFTYLNDRLSNQNWYIKVKKEVLEQIKKKEIDGDYIGVHYRNTDMKHDLDEIIKKIKCISNINKVYLSTDDFSSIEKIDKILAQDYTIIRNTTPFDNSGKNIHYGNPNKHEVIINTLIDMYCLMKSKEFIPSNKSSLSKRVKQLRKLNNFFI